ncbi:MAG TPA: hypothetical protein VK395_19805 [Gemmataceae bacterium]|nr:hypothetical protein [Gemmataceae bacterium]
MPQRKGAIRRLLHAFGPWRLAVSGGSTGPEAWHPARLDRAVNLLPAEECLKRENTGFDK